MGLEEASVLEAECIGVARRRPGLEEMDVLRLGGEGEGRAVEGERGIPGPRRDNTTDAEWFGLGADFVDEGQGIDEFLLGGVEDGCLDDARRRGRDGGSGGAAAGGVP